MAKQDHEWHQRYRHEAPGPLSVETSLPAMEVLPMHVKLKDDGFDVLEHRQTNPVLLKAILCCFETFIAKG
jgi:hypothetical protein